jgi:hypothetical protein
MYTSQCRKNKIELSDYDFERDLSSRLTLSGLTVFEIDVLREIVYNSLSFPLQELSETLEASPEKIILALNNLESTNLFTLTDQTITVNKLNRKYFEVQIERFDEDFQPDTTFFQSLLGLVPIQLLPIWYSVPKTTDDIVHSIIDKCHSTTKVFERYLAELQFEDEQIESIVDDVYKSAELSIEVPHLLDKYSISREKLEEILIYLEFCKVCCLSYRVLENGEWKQEVTPFYEWREYLLFLKQTECKGYESQEFVKSFFDHDFGFIEQFDITLTSLMDSPIDRPEITQYSLGNYSTEEMQHRIFDRICNVNLTKTEDNTLHYTENATIWLGKPIQEKAMALYFSTIHRYRKRDEDQKYNDRDIREVERGLKRIINSGWVSLDRFIHGLTASLGEVHEITLQKKGRHWCYAIPEFDKSQLEFIRHIILHHLLESGMVAIGDHEGKAYISVTRFGQMALGD